MSYTQSRTMPRRAPPTALRLYDGPLPARGKPKFTLPSLPRPAFQAPAIAPRGPAPRTRQSSVTSISSTNSTKSDLSATTLPPLMASADLFDPTATSPSSSQASSPGSSFATERKTVRGPWDSSSSIVVPFDVGSVLPPPKKAAVSPGGR